MREHRGTAGARPRLAAAPLSPEPYAMDEIRTQHNGQGRGGPGGIAMRCGGQRGGIQRCENETPFGCKAFRKLK